MRGTGNEGGQGVRGHGMRGSGGTESEKSLIEEQNDGWLDMSKFDQSFCTSV